MGDIVIVCHPLNNGWEETDFYLASSTCIQYTKLSYYNFYCSLIVQR